MISFATTIAFVLYSIGFSLAAANTQALVSGLQADGYTQIEAKTGVSEVEAVLGSEKFELVHDGVTGAVLKSEAQAERPGDDTSVGSTLTVALMILWMAEVGRLAVWMTLPTQMTTAMTAPMFGAMIAVATGVVIVATAVGVSAATTMPEKFVGGPCLPGCPCSETTSPRRVKVAQ